MQIISGKFRGKKLQLPNEEVTRPTSQKAREALLSILESKHRHTDTFIDAFAGSGAVGAEIISRNFADKVIFIENNPDSFKVLERNIKSLKDINNYQLINKDFTTFIKSKKDLKNTIIFMDPPYINTQKIINDIKLFKDYIKSDTLLILETENSEIQIPNFLQISLQKRYGRTNFLFLSLLTNE